MEVSLITGASSGIGEAFAHRLAGEKHNLLLIARNEEKLSTLCKDLIQKYNIKAQYIAIDLSKPDTTKIVFEETEKRNLQVNWLINNAGIGTAGNFTKLNLQEELNIIQLNLSSLVALTHNYLQKMKERNSGAVINVGSVASFQPVPFQATYAASKAFVKSFTEALVAENSHFKIKIMLLCPGLTETKFYRNMTADDKSTLSRGFKFQTPDMVVDEAMKGIAKNKKQVVSGFKNRMLIRTSYLFPNSLIAKIAAKNFRSNFQ